VYTYQVNLTMYKYRLLFWIRKTFIANYANYYCFFT